MLMTLCWLEIIIKEIQHVKTYLHNSFTIKDLRSLCYFLGFEISCSPSGIVLNQRNIV